VLERESDPTKWTTVSHNSGAEYLINEAPVDELLTKLHAMGLGPLSEIDVERMEFYKTILMGRYTDAQIKAMDRLTAALNAASKSSWWIGVGLIAVGLAAGTAPLIATYLIQK
jgi:hypothetical protein